MEEGQDRVRASYRGTIEPRSPGQMRSVMNVQEAAAKALLVGREALAAARAGGRQAGWGA